MSKKIQLSKFHTNERNPFPVKNNEAFLKLVESLKRNPNILALRPIIVERETGMVLGGNKRFEALLELGYKLIPEEWVKYADDLSEEEKKEFIVTDNIGFGEWDWKILNKDFDLLKLAADFDLEVPEWVEIDVSDFGEDFELASGKKSPFQQITFTLADEQAEFIKNVIKNTKQTEEFKEADHGVNENQNGNALYFILKNLINGKG